MKFKRSVCVLEKRVVRHLLRVAVLPAILFPAFIFASLLLSYLETTPASAAGPAELFKSKCSKCHDPELALKEYRSEKVWQETITRMKEKHGADISEEETGILIEYHVEKQKQEAILFRRKCEGCHPGDVFLDKSLNPNQTRAIIRRMQLKAGNAIRDEDVEIIVRYHARAHRAVVQEDVERFEETHAAKPGTKEERNLQQRLSLFAEKCTECHDLERALSVIKDPELWDQTISRMQVYSKGAISDQEVKDLVSFHVTEQEREIRAFRETCTKCHDDERINSRSMSEEQWLETIRRMQKKAPELIPDEKINLLTAYFHRRELAMAKIFSGKCQVCHYATGGDAPFESSRGQLGGVIVLANEEFGDSLQIKDVESLVSFHIQRQDREMQFYEKDCRICHTGGPPKRNRSRREGLEGRNRAEWISFIAVLQGQELNNENQSKISSQIDYHISRY